jgi:hypothetical protein
MITKVKDAVHFISHNQYKFHASLKKICKENTADYSMKHDIWD